MTSAQVQRTLVKSPPELWAELSDPAALARHLGELGEIRITRIEPEHKVEWTAEGASGTVLINPSAWGTRVTLTARRTSHEPELAPGSDSTTPPVSVQASGQTHPGPSVPASDSHLLSAPSRPAASPPATPAIAATGPPSSPAEAPPTAAEPDAGAHPPGADAKPPQADAKPPQADAEPQADAKPPQADAKPQADVKPQADAKPPRTDGEPPRTAPEPRIARETRCHNVTPTPATAAPVAAPTGKPLERFFARLSRWLHGPELEQTVPSGSGRPKQPPMTAPASPSAGSYEDPEPQRGRAASPVEPAGATAAEPVHAERSVSSQGTTTAPPPRQATLQGQPARTPGGVLSSQATPGPEPPKPIAQQPPREEPSGALSPEDSPARAEEPALSSGPAEPLERLAAGMPAAPAANMPSRERPADEVEAVLASALDSLGAAHHRPFSRS